MALEQVSFSKVGDNWVSAEFEPSTSNISVGVLFPKPQRPGAVTIERSIDGTNWSCAGQIVGLANDNSWYVLKNVCGFVIGTKFKVECTKEPLFIHVLE
jgi:hypothetical protein